jgi:hypothetical protein
MVANMHRVSLVRRIFNNKLFNRLPSNCVSIFRKSFQHQIVPEPQALAYMFGFQIKTCRGPAINLTLKPLNTFGQRKIKRDGNYE